MVAKPHRQRLILPIAPLFGALCGLGTALSIVLVPVYALEDFIIESGLPAILPAAEPPLGATARLGLTLVGAGGVGLVAWFLLFLFVGSRTLGFGAGEGDDSDVPVLRRADAHPDAPARRPLFANQDLGTPFLNVRAAAPEPDSASFALPIETAIDVFAPLPITAAVQALPDDLDMPLSAFDPGAILTDVPAREPIAPSPQSPLPPSPLMAKPAPRPQLFDPGERFETFELTPMVRGDHADAPLPVRRDPAQPRPDTDATIAALLERLERSVAQRVPGAATPMPLPKAANQAGSISDTLGTLRQLATRVG
jgi:hypothetical protein